MILNLERSKKYILACSYGPDSMALFDLLLKENFRFVVCNINYNHRDISTAETRALENYCKSKNIEFYSKSVYFPNQKLNFESWARKVRYDFFFEIGRKLGIYDILIAHNKDDHFETYLMQKERGGLVNYYGIKKSSIVKEFTIERPVLDFSKATLENYCKLNNIPFSIDVSNFDTNYRRNYFRHEVLAKMNEQELHSLEVEITNKNLDLELKSLRLKKYVLNNQIKKEDLLKLDIEDVYFLIVYLVNKDNYHGEISRDLVNDLLFALKKNAKSWSYEFDDNFILKFNYDYVTLINQNLNYKEEINMNTMSSLHFKINKNSTLFSKISNAKKLIIMPCRLSKFYEFNGIKKSVNRCFIDYKMPHEIRIIWPGIFDELGNLLYIPRYQKVPIVTSNSLLLFETEKILLN